MMKTELPGRIAAAAKQAARMDYRLSQLQSLCLEEEQSGRSTPGLQQELGLARLRRDLAVAHLERLRNEFYLTLIGSARSAPREAA